MERGGAEGVEMIMWLGMRGALSGRVQCVHRFYAAPASLGYGVDDFDRMGADEIEKLFGGTELRLLDRYASAACGPLDNQPGCPRWRVA